MSTVNRNSEYIVAAIRPRLIDSAAGCESPFVFPTSGTESISIRNNKTNHRVFEATKYKMRVLYVDVGRYLERIQTWSKAILLSLTVFSAAVAGRRKKLSAQQHACACSHHHVNCQSDLASTRTVAPGQGAGSRQRSTEAGNFF